jgi:hypothetical protein
MRIACSITKATDTQLEYVIIIAFPRQQLFCERVTIVSVRSILPFLLYNIGNYMIQITIKKPWRNTDPDMA